MQKKLEFLVNLALLTTCILASALLIQKLLSRQQASVRDAPAVLKTGDPLPGSWKVQLNAKGATLVAVVRSTCHFCTESMPFYKELAAGPAVRFVVVSDEPATVTRAYLATHDIRAAQIVSAPPSALGVSGTPTVLAVDSRGVIRAREVGKLFADKQRQIISVLANLR
jgi:hypothetical protein